MSYAVRTRRFRRLTLALSALTLIGASLGAGAAHADGVELQTAVATGLAAPTSTGSVAGSNPYCTGEPTSIFYGTQAFDAAKPLNNFGSKLPGDANYIAPNLPGAADLIAATQAGSHSDFCVGFTLTPNADPAIIRSTSKPSASRIQPSTPYPDVADTRVANDQNQAVTGDDMDTVVVDLPTGYVGSLAAVPTCGAGNDAFGLTNWLPANCPDASQMGDVYVRIHSFIGGSFRSHVVSSGSVIYNLEHTANEVGVLGVQVQPFAGVAPVKFIVRLTFSPDGTGRIRAIVQDAPTIVYGGDDIAAAGDTWNGTSDTLTTGDARIGQPQPGATPYPLYIESVGLRIWGPSAQHPTMPGDFGELPTQCAASISAHLAVTTYAGRTSSLDTPTINMTGCDQLDFRPSIDVASTERTPGAPTGVTVGVNLGQNSSGLGTALLKDAIIRMPAGLEVGAQVASISGGLRLCRTDEFNYSDQLTPSTCKDGSAVGTVTITSPLIDYPFVGTVYLGQQRAVGELPDLYLEAAPAAASAPDAPRIKLIGHVSADQQTGQITTTFEDNPQLRFNRIELNFPTGPNSFFTTPERCGTYTGTSSFVPWSGQASVDSSATISIDENCDLPVGPTVAVSSANDAAGARSQTRITLDRPDRGPWLTHLGVSLPTGLLADMNIPTECPDEQAAVGSCPQSSRLGTVTALAGAGSQPWSLAGAMYLASRYDGDVAGAVIVVRAAVGDLDLGDVVVRGRIKLRPTDAGLDFDADIPTRFRGVALQLRRVVVDLDRANLMINPTACGPLSYHSTVASDDGATTTLPGSLTFSGCRQLPFKPTLKAQITGNNKPGGHPGMYVRLDSPAGDAALKSAAVTLPEGIAVDLDNVQTPCSRADFDAVRCPASTRVGSVTAYVSITAEPVPGDIYLVRVAGKSLPGLGLSFTGRYAQRVVSTVDTDSKQRIVTTFPDIPDLPLRQLVVQVDSSSKSPLQLPKTACANGTNWNGTFVGQGGQKATAQTGLQCAAKATVRLSNKRGLTLRLFDFGGRKLRSLKVTLPTGWGINRRLVARRSDQLWVRMTGATAKNSLSDSSLTTIARTKKASTVRLKIGGAAVRPLTSSARKAKRGRLRIRLVFTDGTVQVQKPAVTLK
ncbi:MAG: hypothetical protein QM679_01360 [Patulibacter sp.]